MKDYTQWEGFEGRIWKEEVNVRDFIQKNYTPWQAPPRPPTSSGTLCRNCRRKSAPKAASSIWRPRWSAA